MYSSPFIIWPFKGNDFFFLIVIVYALTLALGRDVEREIHNAEVDLMAAEPRPTGGGGTNM